MRKNVPERSSFLTIVFSVLLTVTVLIHADGQSQLIKDINKAEAESSNEYSELTVCNGKTFFVVLGKELWVTTVSSTYRIKTFKSLRDLTAVGTQLYFAADDGISGFELWKSNGSASGTLKVRDIRAGSTGSNPTQLTNVNGVLYFAANNGTNGNELWKSTGASTSTVMVKDIFAGSGSSNPTRVTNVNGTVYFSANDNVHGYELWKSNGTASGTLLVKDIYASGKTGSFPELLTNVNGVLFFVALDPSTGRELWKSNGAASGTVRVKDIYPGSTSSSIDQITAVNGVAYFMANNGVSGLELWKSNGTSSGTVLVKDLIPGAEGHISGNNFTNVNGVLFFTTFGGSDYPMDVIWRSDGTSDGTRIVEEAYSLGEERPLMSFTYFNGYVYYMNIQVDPDDYDLNNYLMRADLSGLNPTPVKYFSQAEEPYEKLRTEIVVYNSTMIFSSQTNSYSGYKLMKSDGTSNGTVSIKDVWAPNQSSNPLSMFRIDNTVYFKVLSDGTYWEAIFKTDGTTAGTVELDGHNWSIDGMHQVGNTLYFGVEYAQSKYQLWKVIGGSGTPVLVKELPERVLDFHQFMRDINGIFYFVVDYVLWRSDGTDAGTYPLKSFYYVRDIQVYNGNIYIRNFNESYQEELWRSDGTVAGTTKIKTIRSLSGYRSYPYEDAVVMNDIMYFAADDGSTGMELWRSNGTASGTYRVVDLRTADAEMEDFDAMAVYNNKLYFSAVDNTGHWNLFLTTGTASGTTKVADMGTRRAGRIIVDQAGGGFYIFTRTSDGIVELWYSTGTGVQFVANLDTFQFNNPSYYQFINGRMFFITSEYSDADEKNNLWVTDGTSCGTLRLNVGPNSIAAFKMMGTKLIMSAYTTLLGRELWSWDTGLAPASPCATSASGFDVVVVDEEKKISYGPNPFVDDFVLNIPGGQDEVADVAVYSSTGRTVEQFENLKTNEDHRLGQQWTPGVYILRIQRKDGIETIKVAKR